MGLVVPRDALHRLDDLLAGVLEDALLARKDGVVHSDRDHGCVSPPGGRRGREHSGSASAEKPATRRASSRVARARRLALAVIVAALATDLAPCEVEAATGEDARIEIARGVVFHDRNRNGIRDRFERGLRGVAVSNGREVVRTDWRGRYRLPVDDDAIVFVVKPRGYATPLSPDRLPRFHYIHKPAGSPPHLRSPGVAPSGPLPDAIDFPLIRVRESDRFRVLVFGDTQPYTIGEVDLLARDLIEPLIGNDVAFGMTLGDLVGDDLALFEPLNRAVARIGVPWFNTLGNHDMNFRAADDATSDETWERVFGPATYAFQVGRVHFVVLDDVIYEGWNEAESRRGRYRGGLTATQLDFVRNYLATVPERELIVLAMHIPLAGPGHLDVPERRELFEILSGHPHTFSLSSHTHMQYHRFFGPEDGYDAARPHHHLNQASACGSWWLGAPDEHGVPHATMRDGAPNGYSILHFDGDAYRIEFRAAQRPAGHQMHVVAPDAVPVARAGSTEVLVNVFAGSERTAVEMRLGVTDTWRRLERVERPDPLYAALRRREAGSAGRRGFKLPPAADSLHLWAGHLPDDPPIGTAVLEVRATDMFGQVHRAHRLIRIE
jgi:hypothetical protein